MEGDLTDLLQRFSLEGNEISGAKLELEDLSSGVKDCKGSLIGRIMGEKIVNFTGVKNFVTAAWSYPKNLTVMELGPNLFQFNIPNLEDKERIVTGGPWLMDNQILVLNRWSEGIEENYGAFVTAPLWVQFWNLPVHWLSKEVGRKIGAVFKDVKDVVIPQGGGKDGRHLKVLVRVDLSKPLLRGTLVQAAGTLKWVAFKYERCPDFCYKCGIVGHGDRTCKERITIPEGLLENQYGPWMRAGINKSPAKERVVRDEMVKDKRYWKFQNGEMVEREKSRIQSGEELLKALRTSGLGISSTQELAKEQEDERRVLQNHSDSHISVETSGKEHGRIEDPQSLNKENLVFPPLAQVNVAENLSVVEMEDIEEDRELCTRWLAQENRLLDIPVQMAGRQGESQGITKMQDAINKQVKRSYKKLKSPMKTRRALKERNDQDIIIEGRGKRKVQLYDEDMEDAHQQEFSGKRAKALEIVEYTAMTEVEVGSFPNGAPQRK